MKKVHLAGIDEKYKIEWLLSIIFRVSAIIS